MTAARRPRSAALLVGATSGTAANVQSRQPQLEQVLRDARTRRCRFLVNPPLEQRQHLRLDLFDATLQHVTVAVLLELLPGMEDVPGDLEPIQAERLLRSRAQVGVEGARFPRFA